MRILVGLLALMVLVSGCEGTKKALRPMPWLLEQYPKDAPKDYVDGWQAGCESGLASMTNDYFRTFYKFKSDPSRTTVSLYYKPWKDAYNYCRHYAYGPLRESNLRQKLPVGNQGEYFDTPDSPLAPIFIQRLWSGEGSDQW